MVRQLKPVTPGDPIAPTKTAPTVVELLEFERTYAGKPARLDIARKWWGYGPARLEQTIRHALTTTEALEHDAELVHRLTRLRETNLAKRSNRTFRHTPTEGDPR